MWLRFFYFSNSKLIILKITPSAAQLRAVTNNSFDRFWKNEYWLLLSFKIKKNKDKDKQVVTRIKVHFTNDFVCLLSALNLFFNPESILIIIITKIILISQKRNFNGK